MRRPQGKHEGKYEGKYEGKHEGRAVTAAPGGGVVPVTRPVMTRIASAGFTPVANHAGRESRQSRIMPIAYHERMVTEFRLRSALSWLFPRGHRCKVLAMLVPAWSGCL